MKVAHPLNVGFVGLGTMGRPMAGHLVAAGHHLHIHTRRTPPPELVEAGAVVCSSRRELAEKVDVLFIMVPNTPQVRDVLFGEDGVAESLSPGKTVVDMSSISPLATKRFAASIRERGCDYLDAPVSGGEVGARAGTLTIMVGGSAEALDRVRPLLQLMGKNITLIGDNGAGQTCKVANQMIVGATIAAVSEALVFATAAGADPIRVREALLGGFAQSRVLEVHGDRMLRRIFDPGFRVELHIKDLDLALSGARELNVNVPMTAACAELFETCAAAGGAQLDHSALVVVLEGMANTPLVSKGGDR